MRKTRPRTFQTELEPVVCAQRMLGQCSRQADDGKWRRPTKLQRAKCFKLSASGSNENGGKTVCFSSNTLSATLIGSVLEEQSLLTRALRTISKTQTYLAEEASSHYN